jgi:hypothetical protein
MKNLMDKFKSLISNRFIGVKGKKQSLHFKILRVFISNPIELKSE